MLPIGDLDDPTTEIPVSLCCLVIEWGWNVPVDDVDGRTGTDDFESV